MYQLFATCPDELTPFLAEEIRELGAQDIRTGYRVVYFSGSEEVYYRIHLRSRIASRIHRIIKDVPAHAPRIVFDKARRVRYHELFSAAHPIRISVASAGKGTPVENHLIGSKLREAVADSFKHHTGDTPQTTSYGAKVALSGFAHKKRLMISLETSLKSLHIRHYRTSGHAAPLKETLAAGLLRIIGYDGSGAFLDPMCGSGTLAIEAAQIARRVPAQQLSQPEEFGLFYLKDFSQKAYDASLQDARHAEPSLTQPIYASDIDPEAIKITAEAARKGLVDEHIVMQQADFFTLEKPEDAGILIANIPYGERLQEQLVDAAYYERLGSHLKHKFKGWRCGLLVPRQSPYKSIGLKPTQQIRLLNGAIEVVFLVFEIY